MIPDTFATFILTHGRAKTVKTHETLRSTGYTGRIIFLVDNEDDQVPEYRERFGDDVVVFDKTKAAEHTDTCDNQSRRDSIVYARNANFAIAEEMGLTHFWQLDDDYFGFYWSLDNNGDYLTTTADARMVKVMDRIVLKCLDFMDNTEAKTIAFAQAGDFIGGGAGTVAKKGKAGEFSRKAMNSFFFRTDRPVVFRGRVNDDVNLYVECGRRGDLFVTIPRLRVQQPPTQTQTGGCTDVYKAFGTYVKSFYSVLVAPSCVRVRMLHGKAHARIHHAVTWNNACPLIVNEKHRKTR
jgi:hypothetical protein